MIRGRAVKASIIEAAIELDPRRGRPWYKVRLMLDGQEAGFTMPYEGSREDWMRDTRKKITMNMTPLDVAAELSEGNPGALNVIMLILQDDPAMGLFTLLHLDDMNMRGPQIWVGYKDWAGSDIKKFIEAVKSRDPKMVAAVNQHSGVDEKAVAHGASFR